MCKHKYTIFLNYLSEKKQILVIKYIIMKPSNKTTCGINEKLIIWIMGLGFFSVCKGEVLNHHGLLILAETLNKPSKWIQIHFE